jgi:2'-5' RNA ligase
MHRIFIALKINSIIREEIFRRRNLVLDGSANNYKWESIEKIHATIKFIGDVDKLLFSEVIEKIKWLNDCEKIEAKLDKFGFFIKNKKPAILWCGFSPEKKIYSYVDQLNNSLYEIGIPKEEKPFKPHLTILRIKGNEDINLFNRFKEYDFEEMRFSITEAALYESKLSPSGSVYKEIKKYQFK